MTVSPMLFADRSNGLGYVYLIKFELFRNCYKIGCTGNLLKRFSALEYKFGLSRYIVYGFTDKKFTKEREIQSALYEYSNQHIMATRTTKYERLEDIYDGGFIGGIISREHFVIADSTIPKAIDLFDSLCINTCKPHKYGGVLV